LCHQKGNGRMFWRKKACGKVRDSWEDAVGSCRLAPNMEPEGSNKEQRMLEVEGQGGHGLKTGQSVIVEEDVRQGDSSL